MLTLIEQSDTGVVLQGPAKVTAASLHARGLIEIVGFIDTISSNVLERRPVYKFKKRS